MTKGKISLVGVGPGDPELLTRKAERILCEADVVYHPGRDHQTGFAYRIVQKVLSAGVEVRAAAVEMAEEVNRYETLAAELVAQAHMGQRVVFITKGDPLVYSTASRLLTELRLSAKRVGKLSQNRTGWHDPESAKGVFSGT